MVIKNVQQPKVAEKLHKQMPGAEAPRLTEQQADAQVAGWLDNGILSGAEVADLKKLPAEDLGLVLARLSARLKADHDAGKPARIADSTLHELGKLPGVSQKLVADIDSARDKTVTRNVTQGLSTTRETVAGDTASKTRLDNQKAIRDSHKGVVDRPIGGSKGAAYDAAAVLGEHIEGKLDEKLSPEARAAKEQLRQPLIKTGTAIAKEMQKNGTLATFTEKGISEGAKAVGRDIVQATEMTAVNTEAVQGAVNGIQGTVGKLTTLAKGTRFEAAVVEHGGKLTKGAVDLGAKLTKGASAAKTVQAGVQGAELAAGGAQVGAAAGKAAGQSVPIVGQVLGVVTTGLAVAELVGDCAHKPRDWKRIVASGANVIGQAVGIFVPFVGAATTVGKLAADAAMNAHDKKLGKEERSNSGLTDVAGMMSSATGLASPFLEGAGYAGAADKMRSYDAQVKHMAEHGYTSADLAKLSNEERELMMQNLAAAGQEIEKLQGEAKGTPHEATMTLLGEGFAQLLSVWRKSKKLSDSENPEADAKKLQGEAMEAAGKATVAKGAVADA